MENLLEEIIQNGWIVLIYKNTVGWVVQLKSAATGKVATEKQHKDLDELLNYLTNYHCPEVEPRFRFHGQLN